MSFVFKPVESPNLNRTPFYANKHWRVTNSKGSSLNLLSDEGVIDTDVSMSVYLGIKSTASYFYTQSELTTNHDEYVSNIWNSVNGLYYNGYTDKPYEFNKQGEVGKETRNITKDIVVLSFPQLVIGDGIKPRSFEFSSSRYYLFDDGEGNIIGGDIDLLNSASLNENNKNFFYCSYNFFEGINQLQDINVNNPNNLGVYNNLSTGTPTTFDIYSQGNNGYNIDYTTADGINSPNNVPNSIKGRVNNLYLGPYGPSSPYYLSFKSNGHIRIPHNEKLNFKHNEDFTIATWIRLPFWETAGAVVTGTDLTSSYSLSSTTGSSVIISKNGRKLVKRSRVNPITHTADSVLDIPGDNIVDEVFLGKYPYQIELVDPYVGGANYGKIKFSRFDGTNYSFVTSSVRVGTSNIADTYGSGWNLIVCRKSSSYLDVSIMNYSGSFLRNGTGADSCGYLVDNDSDIFVGVRGDFINETPITGSATSAGTSLFRTLTGTNFVDDLGSVHFFNRFISDDDITNLYKTWASGSSTFNTSTPNYDWGINYTHYGNIFYKNGLVVLTDGRNAGGSGTVARNSIVASSSFDFNSINFRSTKIITENEVICVLGAGEYNVSTNPSLVDTFGCNTGIGPGGELINNNYILYDFATGSFFSPYITTIGLYNDAGELLVVGKLASPLKKSSNSDTIFVLKWDT